MGVMERPMALLLLVAGLACLQAAAGDVTPPGLATPGGAGHALLFRDHILLKKGMKDFPTTAMTFEAWISSSDFCHSGTIMSYSKDSQAADHDQRVADFNHFVIFDPRNLLACHDYHFIDLKPDPKNESCHSSYINVTGHDATATFTERDGKWHHLAVTWTAADNGLTEIYWDGLIAASAFTGKTAPLDPNGAFMLGGEQDCFGGCTDPDQGFYGAMDEVRIWKVKRSQADIIRHMRWSSGLENHADLTAYWKFNDPDTDGGQFKQHMIAKDSSGKGNDLDLAVPPLRADVEIKRDANSLHTGRLEFKNNLALNKNMRGMPERSFTVEFWARGQNMNTKGDAQDKFAQLFSYAALKTDSSVGTDFDDDAIRIERYLEDFSDKLLGEQSTAGAISVHINSNENTDTQRAQNWIDFDAGWTDDGWHHIAVTWAYDDGVTHVYVDGEAKTPFWKSNVGSVDDKPAREGGVDPHIAPQSSRRGDGSLALGQDQDCLGGCFSPSNAFDGEMAVLRVWSRALGQDEIRRNMWRGRPDSEEGLAALYIFDSEGVRAGGDAAAPVALDRTANNNHLQLRANPPVWVYSYAPLTSPDGTPAEPPSPGRSGYALRLHDRQVLMVPEFHDFPSTAITVEFWMQSVDTCNPGVPFSYAHGRYEREDNSFLIFNYNSWGVSVMEDEGTLADHLSGVSATDGKWHHVAVTWESASGLATLYQDGRPVWRVTRGKGKTIPSGGTLVIGREQDCQGGCFDSRAGAAGSVSEDGAMEYGAQDFFGLIEEMRVWKVVRTPDEILRGMAADEGGVTGGAVSADDANLVAWWRFDEGKGYAIKDSTNHGHDLLAAEPPTWEAVRWLSNCGNGAVEGAEECDDGDRLDGDGCSAACKLEPGWSCSGAPSRCQRGGAPPPPAGGYAPGPAPAYPPPPAGGGGGGSKAGGVIAGLLVPALVVVAAAAAWSHREAVYEQFPAARGAAASAHAALAGAAPRLFGMLKPGGGGGGGGSAFGLDPEEMDVSPDFLMPSPLRPPGAPGAYAPLAGGEPPRGPAGV
ncbi:MAG: concanavalin A-like lectin/glucanase [Monoraphidium minutum]|nr:MAG: concanavalin A-like lectin/glucanase [Monoraphidium minutum]